MRKGSRHSEEAKQKIRLANLGKKASLETRQKMSLAKSGKNNYWYGKKHTKGTRHKMSLASMGEKNSMYGRTGEKHHNYGKTLSEEHIQVLRRLRPYMRGDNNPMKRPEVVKKLWKARKERYGPGGGAPIGENNPNWRGGVSLTYGENWTIQRLRALQRDNYTCQECGKTIDDCIISVHHIIPFRIFMDYKEANRLENLISLCRLHHSEAEATFRLEEKVVVRR